MNIVTVERDGRAFEAGAIADGRSSNAPIVTYAALCVASLLPFLLVEHLPILDVANHAARLFVACNADDPILARMYRYRFGVIPNLAIDAVNMPLCGVEAPMTVVRLGLIGSLIGIYSAGWLIQRRLFGKLSPLLFLLPAMSLNLVTTMGYVNYLIGITCALLFVSWSIGREYSARYVLAANAIGVIAFFCHIFSLLFLMLYAFGKEASRQKPGLATFVWSGLRTLSLFFVPLALALLVPSDGGSHVPGFSGKIRLLFAATLSPHGGVIPYGLALLVPLYFLLRERWAVIAAPMRAPLLVLGAAVVVLPNTSGNTIDIDTRIFVATIFLFLASLKVERHETKIALGTSLLAGCIIAINLFGVYRAWLPFDRQVREWRRASALLPEGATVLPTISDTPARAVVDSTLYAHLTSYATIDRRVFNPLEFTGVGMQPLSAIGPYASIDPHAGLPLSHALAGELIDPDAQAAATARAQDLSFAIGWPRRFDYVVDYDFGQPWRGQPGNLQKISQGSFFTIYRVRPGGSGARPANWRDDHAGRVPTHAG